MGNQSPTPGPWHVEWGKYSVYIRASAPTKDISICKVMTHRNYSNLNILTYAPELLDICERLLKFAIHYGDEFALEAGHGLIESAKETIAKVKGEPNA
jgi:hypothetical protein